MSKSLLERALDAEDRAEALTQRVADLEGRLKAALNADPTTASRALSWVGRAERAEDLLEKLLGYIAQRSIDTRDFPPGWVTQAQAQMKAVAILRRDQAALAERPAEGDAYWMTYDGPNDRRQIMQRR